jgi:hypothetical protein
MWRVRRIEGFGYYGNEVNHILAVRTDVAGILHKNGNTCHDETLLDAFIAFSGHLTQERIHVN